MPLPQELENINGEAALAWVNQQNELTLQQFKDAKFSRVEQDSLKILEAKNKLPGIQLYRDGMVYNFWRDDVNVRGLWRRTTLEEYKNSVINWEILLDVDALAITENENWVYEESDIHTMQDFPTNRALVYLSKGGCDKVVMREFDLNSKQFVTEGFNLSEAKSIVSWSDQNTLLVATDFGDDSLTESSYPRILKKWSRGTKLEDAEEIFTIPKKHCYVYGNVVETPEDTFTFVFDCMTFWQSHMYLINDQSKTPLKISKPDDAEFQDIYKGSLIFLLRSDWDAFPAGSLVAMDIKTSTDPQPNVSLLKAPTPILSIQSATAALNSILIQVTENVSQQIYRLEIIGNNWQEFKLNYPETGCSSFSSVSSFTDTNLTWYEDYLTPELLLLAEHGKQDILLKQAPRRFDASNFIVEQKHATSKDGTQIPYFIIRTVHLQFDSNNPTLLYGYGGFECALTPSYLEDLGKVWLENSNNVYVVANIRGGNEFGPKWHQAALRENRQKAFDDFIAVAEHLITTNVTSPQHLAIEGASNGGLLVAAVTMQRPELFKAVVCEVPLTDMLRYNTLRSNPNADEEDEGDSAGASWVDEYGDPNDPMIRAALMKYSPLHNIKPSDEIVYPQILFTSSTRDDRVHPYHARMMVARMQEMGHKVFYYENQEGGHSGAANLKQVAFNKGLVMSYLSQLICAPRLESRKRLIMPA